jgi:hypothetical protein
MAYPIGSKLLPNAAEIQFRVTSEGQSDLVLGTSGRDYRSISIIVAGEWHKWAQIHIVQPLLSAEPMLHTSNSAAQGFPFLHACHAGIQ